MVTPSYSVSFRSLLLTITSVILALSSSTIFFSQAAHAFSPATHQPIVILGNIGFTAANGVTSGTGTASDPYLIQGWNIVPCCQAPGLSIEDTSAYFVIRNINLHSSDYPAYGVRIINVTNGRIENSQIITYAGSLSIESSRNIVVSNDEVGTGMIDSSQNITVTGSGSNYLRISSSSNIALINNTSLGGISIVDSTRVTLAKNTSGEISLREATSQQVDTITMTRDNMVNGQPLLFYKDCSKLNINSAQAGEVIVANCSNVRITDLVVVDSYYSIVQLLFVAKAVLDNITGANTILVGNSNHVKISGYHGSVSIDSSAQVQVVGNYGQFVFSQISVSSSTGVSIRGNFYYVIQVLDSSNVTIVGGDLGAQCCTTDFTGLIIENSNHVTVSGNSFDSDWELIALDSSFLKISGNQFMFGAYSTIDLESCSDVVIQDNQMVESGGDTFGGVTVTGCSGVRISGNNMTSGQAYCCNRFVDLVRVSLSSSVMIDDNSLGEANMAIGVMDSSNITISGNNVQSNLLGVFLNDTSSIRVFHNNFLNNNIQAVDTFSIGNAWDNGYPSGGNYWSNYHGTDPDMDGIGDTPYVFNNNQDNFPLMQPFLVQSAD